MKTVQALANDGFEERASRVVFHQVVPFVGAAEGLGGERVTTHHDQQACIGRESIGSSPIPHGGSRQRFAVAPHSLTLIGTQLFQSMSGLVTCWLERRRRHRNVRKEIG